MTLTELKKHGTKVQGKYWEGYESSVGPVNPLVVRDEHRT